VDYTEVQQFQNDIIRRASLMFTDIKPGPKPKREDGQDDRRRHVNPETKPKHPTLPVHKPSK
jgi:hypothetical protein